MTESERIDELLLQWQQSKIDGQTVGAEELCAGDLDLLDELSQRIEAIDQMETLLDVERSNRRHIGEQNLANEAMGFEVAGYELLGELGQGGVGVVYRARHLELDRIVAIKLLTDIRASRTQLARFRTEVEAFARLDHPNIVHIYDVGEINGRPYYSMEYVSGGTLAEQLNEGRPVPRRAAELLEALALAVQFVHDQQLLHRDLKPANVLITEDGTPKLADFGLAKRLDDTDGHTLTGEVIGTPSYMAPEQAKGHSRDVGPLTDVYALGAILYETLTGRPPFKGNSPLDSLRQIVSDEPVSPSLLQSPIPRDLEAICLKCLEKSPGDRYPTAGELAADLRRFLDKRPVVARRVDPLRRVVKWMRRNPALAALVALCMLLVVSGALVSGYWYRTFQEKRETAVRVAPQVRSILKRNCFQCHGANSNEMEKDLNVLDYEKLIHSDRNIVVPNHPDDSRLLQRIADGSMPPEDMERTLPRIAEADLLILRQWINGGAPPLPTTGSSGIVEFGATSNQLARQAKAIFIKHCYACHKYDEAKGGIKIMHHRLLVHVRKTIIPGDPDRSELFQLITSDDPDEQMPPKTIKERMTDDETNVIRQWIMQGAAPFPKD